MSAARKAAIAIGLALLLLQLVVPPRRVHVAEMGRPASDSILQWRALWTPAPNFMYGTPRGALLVRGEDVATDILLIQLLVTIAACGGAALLLPARQPA